MTWVFKQLDAVLRGEGTRAEHVQDGRLGVSGRAMLIAVVVLGLFYGACMGCYNLLSGEEGAALQIVSSALKVPALLLLTLAVTFPSLYVFNALVGSRLHLADMLRLIMAAIGVMIAVLAGFGTIVAFFNFTTSSYPFVLLLNVIVFTIAGVLGLSFLLQTLRRMVEPLHRTPGQSVRLSVPDSRDIAAAEPSAASSSQASSVGAGAAQGSPVVGGDIAPPRPAPSSEEPGALTKVQDGPTSASVKLIFRIWVVIFALVGAQMSWVLRPFIGSYGDDGFQWFRPRGGNFFQRVWDAVVTLFGG